MFGIVDVGGGTRGVYSSGVYDAFIDEKFKADYCIGVSAGAANLITYAAEQKGRTRRFYREYFSRKECISAKSFLKTGSFLSLDYLYDTLSRQDGEDPLDYLSFSKSHITYRAVATRADGQATYFTEKDFALNNYAPLKASCCLPIVCKAVDIGGEKYYDGGMADPIPYKKAFEDGCDKVLVVLTKHREDYYLPMRYVPMLKVLYPKSTELLSLAENFHQRCREAIEELESLEKEGKAFILEPKDCFGMKTLTKDKSVIDRMYAQGYEDGLNFLKVLKAQKQSTE